MTRFSQLLRRIHNNERGAVSLETILVVAAIALPILVFIIKFAWPQIKNYFDKGMQDLQNSSDNVMNGSTGSGTTSGSTTGK